MAEYDAFGRKTGENPLEQPPAPQPVAAPARPRSRVLPVVMAALAVFVLASIGVAVALLAGDGESGTSSGTVAAEEVTAMPETAPPATPAPEEAAGAAQGLEDGSLLTEAALARAVRALRQADLGRPLNLRVAATRVDARLVTSGGLMRSIQVTPDGELNEQVAWHGGTIPSMPWSAVDPAAPERLIRAAAERAKRTAYEVDYLVLMPLPDPTWGLFFKGGTHFQGDAAGKLTRRVSP